MVAAQRKQPLEACSSACRHGQNLAALVIAAGRTNTVRNVGRVALRTLAQLRKLQNAVVCAAHLHAARGWFSLGNAHKYTRFYNFSLSKSAHAVESLFAPAAPLFFVFPVFSFNPGHPGLHNGCCGNSRRVSSRKKGVKSTQSPE